MGTALQDHRTESTLCLGRPKMADHALIFTSSSHSRLTSPFALLIQTYPTSSRTLQAIIAVPVLTCIFKRFFLVFFWFFFFVCFFVPKPKHNHYHLTNHSQPVTGLSTTSYSCPFQDHASQCFRLQCRDLLLFIPLSFPHVLFEFCFHH